jgi:hypothetical protein
MTKRKYAKPPKLIIPSPVLYKEDEVTKRKSIQMRGYSTTIPLQPRRSILDAIVSSYGYDYVLSELQLLINEDSHNFVMCEKVADDVLYIQRKYNPASTSV